MGISVQTPGDGDPKPTGQIEVLNLHNPAGLAFGNPNIADLYFLNQDLVSLCGRPGASRLRSVALAETTFLQDHRTENTADTIRRNHRKTT